MSIVSSNLVIDAAQKDGRFWAHEVHTDNIGAHWRYDYLANAGTDCNAIMTARAPVLAQQLVDQEVAADLAQIEAFGASAVITTNYATLSQVIVAARAAFPGATALVAVNLGEWFNAQTFIALQTAFNFANVSAYNMFKASWFTPNANIAASIRTAAGA